MSTPTLAPSRPRALRRGSAQALRSPLVRLIGRRLLAAIPVLWGVSFVTFLVVQVMPGDAATQLLGANATAQQVEDLRGRLGLDEPFLERYVSWFGDVLTGDLGRSYASEQSVPSIIGERLPVTLELLAFAFVVSLALTIPVALSTVAVACWTGVNPMGVPSG